MQYRAETETFEGEKIALPMPSLEAAKRKARALSRKHLTAYAVALAPGGFAVGHVAFGEGRQSEIAGCIR